MNDTPESTALREYLQTQPAVVGSGYALYKRYGVAKSTAYALLKEYGYAPSMGGQWELQRAQPKLSLSDTLLRLEKLLTSDKLDQLELTFTEDSLREFLEIVEEKKANLNDFD